MDERAASPGTGDTGPRRREGTSRRGIDRAGPFSVEDGLALLPSKWARPRIPPTYVARPQMDRLLDAGTRKPLTMLSAGPGWGKTLAVSAWAASEPAVGPVAWISLDEGDNEPGRFWSYFVAALREVRAVPSSNPLAQMAPGLGDEDEFLRRLVAGLTQLPSSVAIVLDDFHLIGEPAVLSSLTELLRHRIDQLRLVVLTRSDPILPLHRLRTNDDLAEVRAQDLRFDVAEASVLLDGHGVPVSTDEARLLVDRTEGWPAGLRLAALFLARQQPPRRVADFAGDDQTVTSYLAEEVLNSQPAEMRRFLLRTSISERLSSGLADVLTGQARSQHRLETLEASNAFVVGLGPGREWFRYHALLREMLRHRLTVEEPDALPDLHRRAARWFADNGFVIESMTHAANAGDWALLARLFVTRAFPLLASVDRVALGQVLARIPTAELVDTPELTLCAAARLFQAGRFQDMAPHLELAAARVGEAEPDTRSGIDVTRLLLAVTMARSRGDISMQIGSALEALELVSSSGSALTVAAASRAIALGGLGAGLLWAGRVSEARERLEQGLVDAETARIEIAKVNLLSHLGLAAAETGNLRSADGYATEAIELVESRGWAPLPQVATAYLTLSLINLQRNNVAQAQVLLAKGWASSLPEPAPRLALGLAQVRLDASLGRVDAARGLLAGLRDDLSDWRVPTFLARWLAITEAEVELAAGDPTAAVARLGPIVDVEPPFARERLCLARALLASGDQRGVDEVLAPLRTAHRGATIPEDDRVETWLLTALAADALRDDNHATEAMAHAVLLAADVEIRRPFVLFGEHRLSPLLTRLKGVNPELADRVDDLLSYLSSTSDRLEPTALKASLTDRELMILRFLPTMMTNTEIGTELHLSVNTVKAHLKHIYSKLEVATRREAAQRGRELGLVHVE